MSGTIGTVLTVLSLAETLLPAINGLQPVVAKLVRGHSLEKSKVETLDLMIIMLNNMCEQRAAEIARGSGGAHT